MNTPREMLDPAAYDKVWRPYLEAETLPPWCYTSKEWYALEVERLFMKSWNLIGHASRIPEPGDYFTLDFAGIPLAVLRDRDGTVRAFANSCRHRGAQVLAGEGNCKGGIKCPYHGWIYAPDGRLTGAPGMEDCRDFDKAKWGLKQVRLQTWGGFLFATFDPETVPLAEWLGDAVEFAKPYGIDRLKVTRREVYDIECNWKLYAENFKDNSHIKTVHVNTLYRQVLNYTGPLQYLGERGEWYGAFLPHEGTRTILDGVGKDETAPGVKGFPAIREFATGAIQEGSFYPSIYPGTCIGLCIDSAWFLEILPRGPDRMTLAVNLCFHEETVARPDFEDIAELYYKRMAIAVPEDNAANENMQIGLSAAHSRPGRMGHMELAVSHMNQAWVAKVLGRPFTRRLDGAYSVV